ncbi:MAG: hypothetical protein OES13_00020 [Acidimicrobiia bacterium]|nr:hypothetical protein [Acidimicrobiia bacterium]
MSTPVDIDDARRIVFDGLIDYAGLFPPASLDMADAVAGFREARRSPFSWVVDRFIVPASRLTELGSQLVGSMSANEEPWRLSVIADLGEFPSFSPTHRAIASYSSEMAPASSVELVEAKLPPGPADLDIGDAAVEFAGLGAVAFFEMPPDELPVDGIAAARRQRDIAIGAKLRCGGVTADLFPSPERVADFIAVCVARSVPFKCTAGLHHPVRHVADDTGFVHHGFLNILAASLSAFEAREDLVEILSDDDPTSFAVSRTGVSWKGRVFRADSVASSRAAGFIGYGSCDFDEPVADLFELGMLP